MLSKKRTAATPTGMATGPPAQVNRPPDQSHGKRNTDINKPQQKPPSKSSYNSSNVELKGTIPVAISYEDLTWARRIISLEESGFIQAKSTVGDDFPLQNPSTIEKSVYSTLPIGRSPQAIYGEIASKSTESHLKIRASSEMIRKEPSIGDDSPSLKVQHTEFTSQKDEGISVKANSGKVDGAPVTFAGHDQCQKEPSKEATNEANQKHVNAKDLDQQQTQAKSQQTIHEGTGETHQQTAGADDHVPHIPHG